MKISTQIKRFACLILTFAVVAALAPTHTDAAQELETFAIDGVNIEVQKNTAVVFTEGASGLTEGYEVVVGADGIVISVGEKGMSVPEGGFIIAALGSRTVRLRRFARVGERVVFDIMSLTVVQIPDDYNPYYEREMPYNAINATRSSDTTIIYRNKATTQTNIWGIEAVVDSDGFIISVGGNDNAIPEGGFVISSVGAAKQVLTDNCVIGMQVTLDESEKKIRLSYNSDSFVRELDIACADIEAALKKAKNEFRNIDYDALSALLDRLKSITASAKEYLAEGNIMKCYTEKLTFAAVKEDAERALIEYAPVEGRALWLRPKEVNLESVQKTVKEVYEMGFNILCVETVYSNTAIMPMPEDCLYEQSPAFGSFDVLKAYIDECHKYGIEFHLWMPVYRVGYQGSANEELGVAAKKPEWLSISREGLNYVPNVYGNGYFLNPALSEVNEFLLSTYRYILTNYDIDGFQLDYVRYPENSTHDYGYDDYTCSLYKEKTGIDPHDISKNGANWTDWCRFRAQFVTDFVIEMKALVEELRPDVYLSCDVAPKYNESITSSMQDTKTWLTDALIGCVFPMAYGEDAVVSNTASTVELSGDNVFTYIGVGDYGPAIFERQVIQSRQGGADGVAFFAYAQYLDGNYSPTVKKSVFSERALSPSYNGAEAMALQLLFAADRIENVITYDAFDDPEAARSLTMASKTLSEKLSSGSSVSSCETALSAVRAAYDALITDPASARDNAVAADYATVFKIAKINKDDEKQKYYLDNPLPEPYESEATSEGTESGSAESGDVSRQEVKTPSKWYIFAAIGALVAAGAFILIKRKKTDKKGK